MSAFEINRNQLGKEHVQSPLMARHSTRVTSAKEGCLGLPLRIVLVDLEE